MSFTDRTERNGYHKESEIKSGEKGAFSSADYNLRVVIFVLNTDDRIHKWNSIVDVMLNNPKWFGNERPDRVQGISMSGLTHAKVGEDRVNPEVAVLTEEPGMSLDELSEFKKMEELMDWIYAFVPYSVVSSSDTPNTKLILPMGLQKTPSGFGFTRPPSEKDNLKMYSYGPHSDPEREQALKYVPQAAPVPQAFSRLLTAIEYRHHSVAILTRFASSLIHTTNPKQKNYAERVRDHLWYDRAGGLKVWSRTFPGRMRVGWKTADHNKITNEGAPEEYLPGKGGAIIDRSTLRIYDANGVERFTHSVDVPPIQRLIDPALTTWIGTLVCIFPK